MRVLVTRPEADAAPLVAELEARGHGALVEPLMNIEPVMPAEPLDLAGVQALLFTSTNGVRAFAALSAARALPVFAVGDASAEAARAAGFGTVESAAGDVDDLARLVADRLEPAGGTLLHGAGSSLAGDLKGALERAGFAVRRIILYDAVPVGALSDAARAALDGGRLDALMFFSPRTAETFVRLVREHGLAAACARCQAVCLSAAVAARLEEIAWGGIRVAARADRAALLDSLDELAGVGDQGAGRRDEMSEDSASKDSEPGEQEAARAAAAKQVVAAFGGIRPMAKKLGLAVSTVQGWKQRDAIPASRHPAILAAARDAGIALDEATLAASDHPDGEAAPAGRAKAKAKAKAKPKAKAARRERTPPAAATVEPATEVEPAPSSEAPKAKPQSETAKTDKVKAAPGGGPKSAIPASPRRSAKGRIGGPTGRAWLGGLAIGALVMALGFGGAVLTRDTWLPMFGGAVPTGAPDRRVSDLERRLGEQAAALSGLESRLAAAPGDAAAGGSPALQAALEELQRDARDLAERFKRLEQELAGTAASSDQLALLARASETLGGRISNLELRLADLDRLESEFNILAARAKSGPTATTGDVALMLALVQLRERLSGPGPYAGELDLLRGLIGDDIALGGLLTPLDRHAAAGVAPLDALQRDFGEVAGKVVAAAAGGDGDGMIAGVLRRLTDVVTVRPIGQPEGDDAGAIVARAEHKLRIGDLAGTLAELDGLTGAAATAAAEWRARAEARHSVETAVAAVVGQVIDRLKPGDG